jgi:hypothetical protein
MDTDISGRHGKSKRIKYYTFTRMVWAWILIAAWVTVSGLFIQTLVNGTSPTSTGTFGRGGNTVNATIIKITLLSIALLETVVIFILSFVLTKGYRHEQLRKRMRADGEKYGYVSPVPFFLRLPFFSTFLLSSHLLLIIIL